TIQTGALTSICAIIDLILFLVNPTALHLIFNFTLAKLYTNALMSSLNSRRGWGYSNGSNFNSQRTGTEGMASTQIIGGTLGGNNRRLQKTPSSANRFVRVALQRPQEVLINVDLESHELQDVDVMASRTRTDTNHLAIGGTNELKATNTEYDASDCV
ncbi:hypothetical protein AAF712_016431, partial [Marasmius tenuissimus]